MFLNTLSYLNICKIAMHYKMILRYFAVPIQTESDFNRQPNHQYKQRHRNYISGTRQPDPQLPSLARNMCMVIPIYVFSLIAVAYFTFSLT